MTAFHETLFPLEVALKSTGGPQRRTDIVGLGSGAEERNARWAHSRRRYDAGYGVKTFEALSQVLAFFEERRGRLYGFRWRDRLDHSSATMRSHRQIKSLASATASPTRSNSARPTVRSIHRTRGQLPNLF